MTTDAVHRGPDIEQVRHEERNFPVPEAARSGVREPAPARSGVAGCAQRSPSAWPRRRPGAGTSAAIANAASQSTSGACPARGTVAPQKSRRDTETSRRHNRGCITGRFPGDQGGNDPADDLARMAEQAGAYVGPPVVSLRAGTSANRCPGFGSDMRCRRGCRGDSRVPAVESSGQEAEMTGSVHRQPRSRFGGRHGGSPGREHHRAAVPVSAPVKVVAVVRWRPR